MSFGWAAVALLFAVLALPALAAPQAPPTALLIPLDDRPSTLLFPQQIARIGGGLLRVPPRHLLGRAYTPGQPERLAEWMLQHRDVERAIVSTDMLCYGGLIASRTSATPAEEALRRLQVLDGLGRPVVAFATIPRLSLRTSDAQAPYERALHDWAASGRTEPPANVPPEIVQEYLGVRQRNLRVLQGLVDRVHAGLVETLVIGQDDAAAKGPHLAERQALEAEIARLGLRDRVRILSGADELAMNLVAGWLVRRAGLCPTFEVRYSDPEAGTRIPPLESRPLDEALDEHLALSGAARAEGKADVTLFVEVPSEKPFEPPPLEARPEDRTRVDELMGELQEARRRGERVAVADLRLVNRADPVLAREILGGVPLWDLEAYAAWNTPSNALGTAIAQAAVHALARQRGKEWPAGRVVESEKTQQAFTFARLIDDFAYQAVIRPTLSEDVKGLPRDPDPLLNVYGPVGLRARLDAVAWAQEEFAKRLAGRSYEVPALGKRLEFREMRLEVVLPWPRIFEVEARLDLRVGVLPSRPAKRGTSPG